MTPLLGGEFDVFLFAPIDDAPGSDVLSVVSALSRIDVDPWKEAASLARMSPEQAKKRLTTLIGSLPTRSSTDSAPEVVASRLVGLLPRSAGLNALAPASVSRAVLGSRWLIFVGLGVLALLLIAYAIFVARA